LRPRPLAIAFGTAARAHHTLYFDPDLRIKDVMAEISRALPVADRANLDRYGLYLDSNDITKPAVSLSLFLSVILHSSLVFPICLPFISFL
jgi:hypothetical protein